jgi:hypothetical protein
LGTVGSTATRRVPHHPGFPVRLGGVNELHAAFLIESRTRCHGWGRAVGNPGSLNPFFGFKGGIRNCVHQDLWYSTLGGKNTAKGGAPDDLLHFTLRKQQSYFLAE